MTFQAQVAAFHRHYHDSVKTRPDLYRNGDTLITVVLPRDLLDYSNAAAGHSGFGSGARPVGIRRQVRNSQRALAEIFATEQSLAQFIESSERDGPAYVEEVRRRHSEKAQPQPIKANCPKQGFWQKYTKDHMAKIKSSNKDPQQLVQDYNTMTLADFELKYGLVDNPEPILV